MVATDKEGFKLSKNIQNGSSEKRWKRCCVGIKGARWQEPYVSQELTRWRLVQIKRLDTWIFNRHLKHTLQTELL